MMLGSLSTGAKFAFPKCLCVGEVVDRREHGIDVYFERLCPRHSKVNVAGGTYELHEHFQVRDLLEAELEEAFNPPPVFDTSASATVRPS